MDFVDSFLSDTSFLFVWALWLWLGYVSLWICGSSSSSAADIKLLKKTVSSDRKTWLGQFVTFAVDCCYWAGRSGYPFAVLFHWSWIWHYIIFLGIHSHHSWYLSNGIGVWFGWLHSTSFTILFCWCLAHFIPLPLVGCLPDSSCCRLTYAGHW